MWLNDLMADNSTSYRPCPLCWWHFGFTRWTKPRAKFWPSVTKQSQSWRWKSCFPKGWHWCAAQPGETLECRCWAGNLSANGADTSKCWHLRSWLWFNLSLGFTLATSINFSRRRQWFCTRSYRGWLINCKNYECNTSLSTRKPL